MRENEKYRVRTEDMQRKSIRRGREREIEYEQRKKEREREIAKDMKRESVKSGRERERGERER